MGAEKQSGIHSFTKHGNLCTFGYFPLTPHVIFISLHIYRAVSPMNLCSEDCEVIGSSHGASFSAFG